MKNGHLPDHWQLKLWIGLAAVILAALARQSAIDTRGMSSFNANLIFLGICITFLLLYFAFSGFITNVLGTAIDKALRTTFKLLGLKEGKVLIPEKSVEPEPIENKQQAAVSVEATDSNIVETSSDEEPPQTGIVKIETPTPKKIVIDYEGRREQVRQRQENKVYEKEERVILYVGYTMAPFVNKETVEKIIDAVTEFIHCKGVPDFPKEMAVTLPDELTTTDMMHFGWNVGKPFIKYNLHTAHFLKQIFPYTFKDCEICTIERKLKSDKLKGLIKINEHVELFEIPKEEEEVEQPTEAVESTKARVKKESKPKKTSKTATTSKSGKKNKNAMEAAFADMEIEPYYPGQDIFEAPDPYLD